MLSQKTRAHNANKQTAFVQTTDPSMSIENLVIIHVEVMELHDPSIMGSC